MTGSPASLGIFVGLEDARFQLYGHGGEAAADQPRRRAAMGGAVGGGRFEEMFQGNDPHIPTTLKGKEVRKLHRQTKMCWFGKGLCDVKFPGG